MYVVVIEPAMVIGNGLVSYFKAGFRLYVVVDGEMCCLVVGDKGD